MSVTSSATSATLGPNKNNQNVHNIDQKCREQTTRKHQLRRWFPKVTVIFQTLCKALVERRVEVVQQLSCLGQHLLVLVAVLIPHTHVHHSSPLWLGEVAHA